MAFGQPGGPTDDPRMLPSRGRSDRARCLLPALAFVIGSVRFGPIRSIAGEPAESIGIGERVVLTRRSVHLRWMAAKWSGVIAKTISTASRR